VVDLREWEILGVAIQEEGLASEPLDDYKAHQPAEKPQLAQDVLWFFDQLNFEFVALQIADSMTLH
jgi:hypothetical protein